MTRKKTTKYALLSSVMAMVLSVAMLMGTTFAWFTDTASTAVNKIQAGTLNVQLLAEDGTSLEGQTLSWQKAAGADVLWEPGCTYNTQQFYIKNNGNLNLKFKFSVSGITGDAKLLEVLDFTAMADASWFKFNTGAISIGTSGEFDLLKGYDLDTVFYGIMHFDEYVLEPGEKAGPIMISGHMAESAGNEYQGLSIDGIAITVMATQATGEEDSYNGTYDGNAEYAVYDVTDNESLNAAIAQGGIITLPVLDNQVTLGNNQAIGGDTVIDMSGSSQPIQDSIKVEDGKSLTMSNGTLEKNGNLGSIRFDNEKGLDSAGETQAGIFNDMTFKNTKGRVTDMVQIVPRGDSTGKYIFRNCHFIDANVVINGLSGDEYGDNGKVEIVFENCTFDINGWPAINFSSSYCTGSMTVKDCTFNMTTPAGFSAAIQAGGSKDWSLTFAGTNYINNNGANTVNAYMPGTGANVTGQDTIATTGAVTIP